MIYENSMKLPLGKTCFDCESARRCRMLFGNDNKSNQCDFHTVRFVQKEALGETK